MVKAGRLFSIGKVSELSGVPVETIRTWERRYATIVPVRTKGGHRKYTARDIDTLKTWRTLTESGARISDVAHDDGDRALGFDAHGENDAIDASWIDRTLAYAQAFDAEGVERQLSRSWMSGEPLRAARAMLDLLRVAGERWHDGALHVGAEHLVERAVSARIAGAMSHLPRPTGDASALLACAPGELHEVSLLSSSLVLRGLGLPVTYLGANVPVDDIVRAASLSKPQLALVSATMKLNDEVCESLAAALTTLTSSMLVFAGGEGARALVALAPAVHFVESVDAFRARVMAMQAQAGTSQRSIQPPERT